MKKISMLHLALAVSLLVLGCKKKPENADGPLEAAGEEADQTAGEAGQATEEAAEDTADATEEAGEKVEDAVD